jgi:hypothetical protein
MEELAAAGSEEDISQIFLRLFENNAFDGFDLQSEDGLIKVNWWRDGNEANGKSGWSMLIPLPTDDGQKAGRLVLYRGYSDQPLLVDINLFTNGFPLNAGEAIGRMRTSDAARFSAPSLS